MLWPQVELLCSKNRNFRLHVYGFGGECHYFSKTLEIKSCSSAEHACHVANSTLAEEVSLDNLTDNALQQILKALMNREGLNNLCVKNQSLSEVSLKDMSKVKEKFQGAKLVLEDVSIPLSQLRENPACSQLISTCPKVNECDQEVCETGFEVRTMCCGKEVHPLASPLQISGASVADLSWMFSLGHNDLILQNPDFDVELMET
ncbi:unnamed protein product [Durusdinium trenchii]|uniref:Uncharacterized protein n=1 Tax=Durusdinium trenchii TaxID=1381693 RepID=A0ABP0NE34_9DINO